MDRRPESPRNDDGPGPVRVAGDEPTTLFGENDTIEPWRSLGKDRKGIPRFGTFQGRYELLDVVRG